MSVLRIEQRDVEEALIAFADFRDVQTSDRSAELRRRLDAGEDPQQILSELVADLDHEAMAESLGRLREAVGLSDDATRAFWHGLTDFGIDHNLREVETAAFISLFLGVRASQAAADRSSR